MEIRSSIAQTMCALLMICLLSVCSYAPTQKSNEEPKIMKKAYNGMSPKRPDAQCAKSTSTYDPYYKKCSFYYEGKERKPQQQERIAIAIRYYRSEEESLKMS